MMDFIPAYIAIPLSALGWLTYFTMTRHERKAERRARKYSIRLSEVE